MRGNTGNQRRIPASNVPGTDLDFSKIPTLKPVFPHLAKPTGSTSAKSAQNAGLLQKTDRLSSSQRTLSEAQVLKVLEARRSDTSVVKDKAIASEVALLAPEDTNTRLVLKDAVARNAPVFFAVQLQWSVQPVDVKSVPQHPLFQAYKLYAAEGQRAGRAWFFLRLGFFSDGVSAKQVAHYLRKDFASAAVVPVSPQEREQVRQHGCSESSTVARSPGRNIR